MCIRIPGYQEVDLFSEIRGPDFDSVFGQQQLPQMQPQSQVASSSFAGGGAALVQSTPPTSTAAFLGDVLQPMAVGPPAPAMLLKEGPALSVLTSDVESSLARAAANLGQFCVEFILSMDVVSPQFYLLFV